MGSNTLVEQIVKEVIEFIALSIFPEGSKLPSVRSYAQRLGINPNTVQKAYQILEEQGHIQIFEKRGSFVANREFTFSVYKNILINKLQEIVENMQRSGINIEEVNAIVQQIYELEVVKDADIKKCKKIIS